MRLKVLAAVLLIVIGVGAVGFAVFGPNLSSSSSPQYLTATASRGTVAVQAVATGTVQSTAAYGLSFGVDPEIISGASSATSSSTSTATTNWNVRTVPVTVGQTVKKGQVLATADPSNAKLAVAIAKANLASAQAKLTVDEGHPASTVLAAAQNAINSAQLSLTIANHNQQYTIQQDELAVQQAQAKLTTAQTTLQQTESPNGQTQYEVALQNAQAALQQAQQNQQNTITQDQLALQQAQQAVINAQTNYLNATGMNGIQAAQNQVTSAQQALQAQQTKNAIAEQSAADAVTQAQNALAAAQATYDLNAGPNGNAVQTAQQNVVTAQQALTSAQQKLASDKQAYSVAQAQQSLASAQTNYASSTGPQPAATISADQAAVSNAQSNLSNAEQTLANATLTAPADGQIVAINVEPNTLAPTGWAITMQTASLEATASFAETSVVGLKAGQPASVTVTAPNVTVPGTVSSIQPVGTSSGSNSVVTFTVTVSLSDPPATVLSGMSASIAVTTAQAQNVVTVPAIAVVGSSGNYEVRVLDSAGQEQAVPVQVGLMSTSLAEIQSGITPGETIVIGTVSALNSSTTSGGGFGGIGGIGGAQFRTVDRGAGGAAGAAGNGGTRTTTGGAGAGGAGQP